MSLQQEKVEQTEGQWLFLEASDKWGLVANCHAEIWGEANAEAHPRSVYLEQKPWSSTLVKESLNYNFHEWLEAVD